LPASLAGGAGARPDHPINGVNVTIERIPVGKIDVSNAILSYAADTYPDLIVMGGYGHSRLREFILGGTTRGMLASMTKPTLMSH
jgi:nucleotide-binding universal stress UspA family protein